VTLNEGINRAAAPSQPRAEFSVITGTNVMIGQPIGHRLDHCTG
jgi:hypothetical protein